MALGDDFGFIDMLVSVGFGKGLDQVLGHGEDIPKRRPPPAPRPLPSSETGTPEQGVVIVSC